ncbi:MAG: cardiolipin synthase, partial [Bacillales bacterium]|nr:cardiolipin synthase [Bacillales bacterium]
EFLEAGVKIYEYQKGFMHSKFLIIDGEVASIGTANMDMRSFHLNFEVNACLYKTNSVNKLGSDYLEDISNSEELVLDKFGERSFIIRIVESLARLVSPLL